MKAIEIKEVSASFGENEVLKDINLSLDVGTFLGIMGPNGGGKTTLLKIILGLIKPDKGEVKVLGRIPEQNRDKIGYVPQYSDFDSEFPISVKEVVLMGRLGQTGWRSNFSKRDYEIVHESLKQVEMLKLKDKKMSDLSGGQHQRVLIARALATEPEILILDEPTASVDKKVKSNIYEVLKEMNEKGKTILISTHDTSVIYSKMDSLACLNKKLIFHGKEDIPLEVFEEAYGAPVSLLSEKHQHHIYEDKNNSIED